MQRAEFEASQSQLDIVDKLNHGIKEQKLDQAFANDMLEEIARAVGVPVEPSEISKEIASIRWEKEEAAHRKERAEFIFLEHIILLLSQADTASDFGEVKKQYFQRVQVKERYGSREKCIPPLNYFRCSITEAVMVDPVSLCTGTTCERSAIEVWFDDGNMTDPKTNEVLEDTTLRSNIRLRESIVEWRELNYCFRIKSIRENLLSNSGLLLHESLSQMQALIKKNSINKDWISIGELIDMIISILGNSDSIDVKMKILITWKGVVQGHARNKEKVVESQGWRYIISCLHNDSRVIKEAIDLLYELLQDRSGWNKSFCEKLSEHPSTVNYLVTILNGPVSDSIETAEKILTELFETDEENICLLLSLVGSESSRMSMAKAIINFNLEESNLKLLGEKGIIPHLLEILSGSIESKELSLSALVKLAGVHANKGIIAAYGGVPILLYLMFSLRTRALVSIKCFEILEKLSSSDGIAQYFRKPALRTLLGICKFETGLVKKAVLVAHGVPLILPLLDDSDSEIRETAITLLFLFSQHEPEGVVEYLFRPRRLEALVGVCNVNSTFCLLEENALPGLIKLLQEEVHATAYEAIQTLSTLVIEDFPQRGARVLHESNAMRSILKILNWGNDSLKTEALGLLEKVFVSKEMVESYGSMARLRLFHLTGMNVYGDGHLRRKASRVLSLLERYSRSSSHSITGVVLSENLRI
ncbi:hypothetical protein KIW84_045139 [Lathyrus oleraceus]|uniref:RING-type E3 ubiquitin transferase n=1 Tax=Pisum sativum TaxID=3888 RepID=A0A9D5ARC2_PEA|nr:hypothetical protein KIW84_045139 [Pisum sativum]